MTAPSPVKSTELELRERIVKVARAWIGTPYFACEMRRGKGCDCGSLLAGVYFEAGIIQRLSLAPYDWTRAWAVKGGDAQYLEIIQKYCREITCDEAQAGDIVMYHVGKGWSHSGIIVRWPGEIIHAMRTVGVIAGPGNTGFLSGRQTRFWSVF